MCLDRWFNNNKEFKNKIIAELAKLKNKLSTTQQKIYDIYLTELQVKTKYNYYYASFSLEERLSNHPLYLHWQKILPEVLTKPISSYFSDDERIVLQTILGKDKADLFFLALDNLMDYPYQTNWYRRTLRSHQSHLYLSRMFDFEQSKVREAYKVEQVPTVYLIGPDGNILLKNPEIEEIHEIVKQERA